jgi:hypothetical protein
MSPTVDEPSIDDHLYEIRRQRRLIDQMTSMHAALRDWGRAIGNLLTCAVLIASLIGVAFAFADDNNRVSFIGISALRSTWLGWLAVSAFAAALVQLVLNPAGASKRRSAAVETLARAKDHYRAEPDPEEVATARETLTVIYETAIAACPDVPNWLFNPLKASHMRKVEISKLLSEHPGTGYWGARRAVNQRAKRSRQAAERPKS